MKGSRLQQIIEYRNREGFKKLGGLNQEENTFIDASIAWREQTIKSEKQKLVLKGLLIGVTTLLVFAALLVFPVSASKTCQKYAWDKADTSHFFVNQGFVSPQSQANIQCYPV
ncbi:hypothetical protein NIES2101_15015 [Calothrix sp. HK-06]|nr:hypothetical protein NIES2101_15015 [Calothrix sp. HK-06]